MSRLAERFAALKPQSRTALIPFIVAGDPRPEATVTLMHTMVDAGADVIELGIPFSDPMAEGPVIQRASERALRHNVSLNDVLAMVRAFRQSDSETPVVLMGYLNPIEVMGYRAFANAAGSSGVDGVITVDLPPEEGQDYIEALQSAHLDPVFLLAPTSTSERISRICQRARGFVYYVSLKGVTGAQSLDVAAVADKLDLIRRHTNMPVGVGFGIKDPATAAEVARVADAVVIGSALVKLIEETGTDLQSLEQRVRAFVSDIRVAVDAAVKTPAAG